MLEYVSRTGRFCAAGTEILRCRIVMPSWEEHEAISCFYREVADRAFRFCENDLRDRAQAEFDTSQDARKRFCFPALRYVLDARVTYEDDRFVSVKLQAELSHRGLPEPIQVHCDAHVWQLEDETMLPPEQVLRCFASQKLPRRLRKGADGVLFDGERLLLCRGGHFEELNFI